MGMKEAVSLPTSISKAIVYTKLIILGQYFLTLHFPQASKRPQTKKI